MGVLSFLADSTKRRHMIRIFIVGFVLFYNSASAMYLYSFLPYMMVDFGVVTSETSSGKYAAWMASGYFFARFLSSPFWGTFIDRSGRKRGLMIVLAAVSTLTLLFGLAQSFWWALAIRLITGFINGLSIIGKVLTTEVCPEDMKAWSISVISTLWSLGMTVGPFLGSLFYGWIDGWPYLASAIAMALFGYTLMFLTWVYIDETLEGKTKTPQKDVALKDKVNYKQMSNDEESQVQENSGSDGDHSQEHAHSGTADDSSQDNAQSATQSANQSVTEVSDFQKEFGAMNRFQQFKYLLNIPNVMKLIFIFSINTFYAAVYGELIPFWAAAKYKDGGLDFSDSDISQMFIYLTGPQLILQLFLYPVLQKKRGDFWLLSMGHYIHIPMFLLLPFAHWLPQGSFFWMKSYLVFWMFTRNIGSFMNFSALQRYTNDTISPEKRGQINGFQIAFSSLLQTLGPVLGGYVLAVSMDSGLPYPFNYHFVFLLMVVITILTLYVIYSLNFADSERKKLKGENGITA